MCSPSDSTNNPTTPPVSTEGGLADGHFRGIFVGEGDTAGVADLTITAATTTQSLRPKDTTPTKYVVSGTLTVNLPTLGTVTVTGTLDLATNTATISGGNGSITVEGTYKDGAIDGTWHYGIFSGPFHVTNEEVGGVKTFCGAFTGGYSGRWSMLAAGSQVFIAYAKSSGGTGTGLGTIANNQLNATLTGDGTAVGAVEGERISGPWTLESNAKTGSFETSSAQCAALDPAAPTDAGTDGGTPGTPETIYTSSTADGIGFLAVAGNQIAFTIDHPYFQNKRTVVSVTKDGATSTQVVPMNTDPDQAIRGLTANATDIFWLGTDGNNDHLWKVPITGASAPTKIADLSQPSNDDYYQGVPRLLNDGTTIFYSWYGSGGSGVKSIGFDGTVGGTGSDGVGVEGIGFDGANLLYGEFNGIQQVSKALGASTTVVPKSEFGSLANIVSIVTDANNYYVLVNESFTAGLWRRPKAGGPAVLISAAGSFTKARGLVLLDGNLYTQVGTSSGGQQGQATANLARFAATATNVQPTVIAPSNLFDVITDGTYIYWGAGKTVRRLHK